MMLVAVAHLAGVCNSQVPGSYPPTREEAHNRDLVVSSTHPGAVALYNDDFIPAESSGLCTLPRENCGSHCADRHKDQLRIRYPGRAFHVRCCMPGWAPGTTSDVLRIRRFCPYSHFCGQADKYKQGSGYDLTASSPRPGRNSRPRYVVCVAKSAFPRPAVHGARPISEIELMMEMNAVAAAAAAPTSSRPADSSVSAVAVSVAPTINFIGNAQIPAGAAPPVEDNRPEKDSARSRPRRSSAGHHPSARIVSARVEYTGQPDVTGAATVGRVEQVFLPARATEPDRQVARPPAVARQDYDVSSSSQAAEQSEPTGARRWSDQRLVDDPFGSWQTMDMTPATRDRRPPQTVPEDDHGGDQLAIVPFDCDHTTWSSNP